MLLNTKNIKANQDAGVSLSQLVSTKLFNTVETSNCALQMYTENIQFGE